MKGIISISDIHAFIFVIKNVHWLAILDLFSSLLELELQKRVRHHPDPDVDGLNVVFDTLN